MLRQRFNKLCGKVLPYMISIEANVRHQNEKLKREYFCKNKRLAKEYFDKSI